MTMTAPYPELAEVDDDDLNRHLEYLERRIGHLEGVIAPLRSRITKLELQAGEFGWKGVWRNGAAYTTGNFVTDRGALWHCEKPTRTRPGSGDPGWRLAVKQGRFD